MFYCSCGYAVRGEHHKEGEHHKTGKTKKIPKSMLKLHHPAKGLKMSSAEKSARKQGKPQKGGKR